MEVKPDPGYVSSVKVFESLTNFHSCSFGTVNGFVTLIILTPGDDLTPFFVYEISISSELVLFLYPLSYILHPT